MKKNFVVIMFLLTLTQAMAFETTGTSKTSSSIPQIYCEDLRTEAETAAILDSEKKAEDFCLGTGVIRLSDYTIKGQCYTSGVFQSITNYSVSAKAEFECVGAQ